MLFTNWGNIGEDQGQFQNTPFSSAAEAVNEFEKIFSAKTENEWSDRDDFFGNSRKYVMLDMDLLVTAEKVKRGRRLPKTEFARDCFLPEEVKEIIKGFVDLNALENTFDSLNIDTDLFPLEILHKNTERLEEAAEILEKLDTATAERMHSSGNRHWYSPSIFSTAKREIIATYCLDQVGLTAAYYDLLPPSGKNKNIPEEMKSE